jgi:hypothetical protein
MLKINHWNELRGSFDGIAVVGNAPSALGYEIGRSIDSRDCVIRMNNYRLSEEFAPCIGSRTTVFVTNCFPMDLRKTQNDLLEDKVKMIWAAIPLSDRLVRWPQYLETAEKRFSEFELYVPSLEDILAVTPEEDSLWNRWLRRLLLGHAELVPSSGLVAIALALKLEPKSMLISGFDFFSGKQAYYYSPAVLSKDWGLTHHHFEKEPGALAKLILCHPNVQFELALDSGNVFLRRLKKLVNVRFIPPAD